MTGTRDYEGADRRTGQSCPISRIQKVPRFVHGAAHTRPASSTHMSRFTRLPRPWLRSLVALAVDLSLVTSPRIA